MFALLSEQSFFNALQFLHQSLPMVERIKGLYYDKETKGLKWMESDDNETNNTLLVKKYLSYFQRERLQAHKFDWLSIKKIPFEKNYDPAAMLQAQDIFESANVLLLRMKNRWDRQNDLIFLFFPNQGAFFNDKILSEDQKNIIGNVAHNLVSALSNNTDKLSYFVDNVKESQTLLNEAFRAQKEELAQNDDRIIDYVLSILQEMKKETGIQTYLSRDAEKMIREYKGPIHVVVNEIKNAMERQRNIHGTSTSIEIQEYELRLRNEKPAKKTAQEYKPVRQTTPQEGALTRTERFLNRLEEAVNIAIGKNEKTTGKNIGECMNPQISAPAISDAIKKHSERIVKLMEKDPHRWPSLTHHFRPIQNLIERKNG